MQTTTERTAYESGRDAALRGCYRVLTFADSDQERNDWLRGFDSVPSENRGRWPLSGPVPEELQSLAAPEPERNKVKTELVRFNVYFSDPADADSGDVIVCIPTQKEANRIAKVKQADGWTTEIEKETLRSFIESENDFFAMASCQVKINAAVQELENEGWPDATLSEFVSQAKEIGDTYGRTRGFMAAGFEEFLGFDENTRSHLARIGTEPTVVKLAEQFAQRAFWIARLTVSETASCDGLRLVEAS